MIAVDDSANGREIVMHRGDVLAINLNENATTGFRWEIHSKPEGLRESVSPQEGSEATPRLPGQGTTRHFRFQALHKGAGEIHLQYRRSWEHDKVPARSFKLKVRVQD